MHIFIHIYIEKATASAADLWDLRPGCLDAWMLGCVSNELFGTPVGAAAPVSGPGRGGGVSGSDLLWTPVAGCGPLWRISDTPLRWYKVGCILQPAA